MTLELSKCEIRTPTGDALVALYRMMMEAFPVDRPVFAEMIQKGKRFYTWTPYAMYLGDELLGNVSLVPMRIWLGSQPTEVVGIASVATQKQYRRQGVATHLVRHSLGIVDERKVPAVLFTGLPGLYEPLGFKRIDQIYEAAPAAQIRLANRGFNCEPLDQLDQSRLDQMAAIYADEYPNYDGKVVRDPDYWQLYQMLFNPYPRSAILLCTSKGRAVGYARVEVEEDRLLMAELCGRADAVGAADALLRFAADYARQAGVDLVTFAFLPGHFAREILQRNRVPLEPEPAGAHRETFMARPPAGQSLGQWGRLQWSLADKF